MGDAINWEWMIECALNNNAELVIVSRDSDYGVVFEDTAYINDHLRQEFSERVSRKRKLLLYTKLSAALKHFKIPVTPQEVQEEEQEEEQIIQSAPAQDPAIPSNMPLNELIKILGVQGAVETDCMDETS